MTEYTMHIYAPATDIEAGIQVQKNIRDNNRLLEVGRLPNGLFKYI
jgi:hypothetical protein